MRSLAPKIRPYAAKHSQTMFFVAKYFRTTYADCRNRFTPTIASRLSRAAVAVA
jgi:hypothetical protein